MTRLVFLVTLGAALAAAAAPHLLVPADWAPGEKERVREDLQLDLRQLRSDAPSAISGVVLTSVGGVIAAGGGVLLGLGVAWSQGVGGYGVIGLVIATFGVILALPGLVLLIVGVVNLITSGSAKAAHQLKVDEVQRRLDALDRERPLPPSAAWPRVPAFEVARF